MIICSRCGAEVGNILDHYDEHHGMPVAKVRDYRVFWDEPGQGHEGVYIPGRGRPKVEHRSEICDT